MVFSWKCNYKKNIEKNAEIHLKSTKHVGNENHKYRSTFKKTR